MGVAIGKIIDNCKQKIDLADFRNKQLGFDAYNILYQFITTIRGSDGQPLKNSDGDITSHLSGLFYRMSNILATGIKPIFVFDGVSHQLKDDTKKERRQRRELAKEKYDDALKLGNTEDMKKYARQTITINQQIIDESKELLEAMGISYINAPSEAEAQIACMTKEGIIDYSVSQDFDCFLFGSPNLIRNATVSGKKKIAFKKIYVDVYPQLIQREDILKELNINYDQLLWMSILIGTDFNKKIDGVGPKTALKLVKENNSFEDIQKHLESKNKTIDFDYKEIEDIFRNPNVDTSISIPKFKFDRTKVESILINRADFDSLRTENYINNFLNKKEEIEKQKTIDKWF